MTKATFDYSDVVQADLFGADSFRILCGDKLTFLGAGGRFGSSQDYFPANHGNAYDFTPSNREPENGYIYFAVPNPAFTSPTEVIHGGTRFQVGSVPSAPDLDDYNNTNFGDEVVRFNQAVAAWEAGIDNRTVERIEILTGNDTIIPLTFDKPVRLGDMMIGNFAPNDAIAEYQITGSGFRDFIVGAPNISTTFQGTTGNDDVEGGSQNDTFNYWTSYFLSNTNASLSQHLNGKGEDGNKDGINKGTDLLRFPGAPNEAKFTVDFRMPDPLDWTTTVTTIDQQATSGSLLTANSKEIERVEFANPINNPVTLTGQHIASEMLQLAAEVYGPRVSLGHGAEALGYDDGGLYPYTKTVSKAAIDRKWHPVAAMELGIKPADYGPIADNNNLKYSFVDGFYAAVDDDIFAFQPGGKLGPDHPEANALVLTGVVNGQRTLAISFRGTDQPADFDNYKNFIHYYNKYKPLTDAIKTYVNDPQHGIQQVLVSGHSLGAGAVQRFMEENAGDGRFRAYTDGSPGGDEGGLNDARIMNFVRTDDPVTKVPAITQVAANPIAKFAIQAIASGIAVAMATGGGPLGVAAGVALATGVQKLLDDAYAKYRDGSEIFINSEIAAGLDLNEHDKNKYVEELQRIQQFANDPKNVNFYISEVAQALRADLLYTGRTVQIAPGSASDDSTHPLSGDNFDIGADGNDNFSFPVKVIQDVFLFTPLPTRVEHPGLVTDGQERFIDGGAGVDRLTFVDVRSQDIFVDAVSRQSSKESLVTYFGKDRGAVGTLTNVEMLVFPQETPDKMFVALDGYKIDPQKATPGQKSLQVDSSFSYADARGMAIDVTGSSTHDVILVGSGSHVVGGIGDDVIVVSDLAAAGGGAGDGGGADAVAGVQVDGNSGDDVIIGGAGNDKLAGSFGDDFIDGGPGIDTVVVLQPQRGLYDLRSVLGSDGVRHVVVHDIQDLSLDGTDTLVHVERLQFAGSASVAAGAQLNRASNVSGSQFDDVLFQNAATGQVFYAKMLDGTFQGWGAVTGTMGGDWKVVGSGDLDPETGGGAETFVQHQPTGTIYYASLDTGATTWGVVSTNLTPDWKLRAVADINGDASVDAVIQNQTDGTIYYGDMRGGTFRSWGVVNAFLTSDWVAVGAGDINGDGFADVLVQQQSTGTTYFTDMAGGQFSGWGVVSTTLTADWKVRAVADVTGDGLADAIFQNSAGGGGVNPGTTYFADVSTGTVRWGVVTATVDADWVVQGTADVDNDGYADVLFQNAAGGNGINPGTTYYANMGPGGFEGWGAIATSITADWHAL